MIQSTIHSMRVDEKLFDGNLLNRHVTSSPKVSVVIPAYNEEHNIGQAVKAIFSQHRNGVDIEVIVVDDGSTDDTVEKARSAGAKVLELNKDGGQGKPGAVRNKGARISTGDPIIFLDADCVVDEGWLQAILDGHANGATIVGGALALPPGFEVMARCDYYCSVYVTHPERKAGDVPHHPPANLSVRRAAFLSTVGFTETAPFEYTNEERAWQAELHRMGHRIYFAPKAIAYHYSRPGFPNLMRRNYRWGYTAIECKHTTGMARMAWLYRYPVLLIVISPLLAIAHTLYILTCWIRAGRFEPLFMLPVILVSRLAYTMGMSIGGLQWLRYGSAGERPPPRWS